MVRLFLIALVFILGFTSCGDDTPECTSETIVGTYVGEVTCDECSSCIEGPVTYTIESAGGNNYTSTTQDGDTTEFTVDGCDVTIPTLEIEFFGIMIKTSGNGKFEGGQFNLTIDSVVDGEAFTCIATTTKQ